MTDTTRQSPDTLSRARELLDSGRHFEAEALLAKELASNPYSAEANALLSMAVRDSDMTRSLAFAQRAVALQPAVAWFHVNFAWAAHGAKRHNEALSAAREAVRLDPNNADGFRALAQILAGNRKMMAEAKAAATRAHELAPYDEATWIAVGNVARADDDLETADDYYREALRINPESQVAKHNLARNREPDANIGDGTNLLQAIIRLDPRDEHARSQIDELMVKLLDSFLWLALLFGVFVSVIIVGIIDATN